MSATSSTGNVIDLAPGVTQVQTLLVNCFLVAATPHAAGSATDWVLIDTGIPGFSARLKTAAEERFGSTPPKAILLTHAHFDHVGMVQTLAEEWDVPVYAHELELPYLTGQSSYPPPDPSVGGGLMARSAALFPKKPIDLGSRVQALPADGSVPGLPQWKWLATPGHSPGHVSFLRPGDRTLIVGDAFVTQKQESLFAVLTNKFDFRGPPTYFTTDWPAAWETVRKLAALQPRVAGTGHGLPVRGPALRQALEHLATHFWEDAVPTDGRYVRAPAKADRTGTTFVPPKRFDPVPYAAAAAVAAVVAGIAWWALHDDEA